MKPLFIDTETVPEYPVLLNAPDYVYNYFKKLYISEVKPTNKKTSEVSLQQFYKERVSFMAEFSKVVCISLGYETALGELKVVSFCGEDEKRILFDFNDATNKTKSMYLCGHNIIEFDNPFLCKRLTKHHILIPALLDTYGKKPWELYTVDTMQVAKFGSYRGATSLANLCYLLNVPSPKQDMDGSMVSDVFYSEKTDRFKRIADYCEQDIIAVAKVDDILMQRFKYVGKEITIIR